MAGSRPGLLAERHRAGRTCSRRVTGWPVSTSKSPTTHFTAGGIDFPAGSWILPAQDGLSRCGSKPLPIELGLDFTSVAAVPDVPRHEAKAAAHRRVGAVGRYRFDRLAALFARSAQDSLHLSSR